MIEILSETPLITVQDQGRYGARRFGVGTAGAMDRLALAAGNLMVGNGIEAAGLEIPMTPFRVKFHADTAFALTGADADASLGNRNLLPFWSSLARAGDTLTLNAARSGATAYLAVAGGFDVPTILGSRSTQLRGEFGGYEGRMLKKGDRLAVGIAPAAGAFAETGVRPPSRALPLGEAGTTTLRVLPAAEYEYFIEAARANFWSKPWKITPQSNRAGYRLVGPTLELAEPLELRSHGLVPGVIQVPHGGQPIIQLADAATAGGYPKIGTVIEADLWRLGQARLGSDIRFTEVRYEEAVAALDDIARWLDGVRDATQLVRNAHTGWRLHGR
jgi:biotin-dependent carboxylase-like uncharacterized protein